MSNLDTETQAPEETHVPLNETPVDGPGSGRSEIRKQLEKSVESVRKSEPREENRRPNARTTPKSRARQEMEEQEQETPAEPAEAEAPEQDAQSETKAPDGWTKEAKAEWANVPAQVQAAVLKREADVAKGVQELQKKYTDIDQALQPRMEVIRRHGHTPAQAVNQLFAWFEALSANPGVAFPALANSFKYDLRTIPGIIPQQQQAAPQAQQAQEPAKTQVDPATIPPAVETYVKTLEQKIAELQQGFSTQIGQLSSSFQQQSQAKTEEILTNWAKDKPYFEDVRRMMAHLIASHAVPPLPNGTADLDRAYDMAMYALPDVRGKVLADQQKTQADAAKAKANAEKAAQQAAADKARRASGSLSQGAPGNPVAPQGKNTKKKTVRESIEEARAELADQ